MTYLEQVARWPVRGDSVTMIGGHVRYEVLSVMRSYQAGAHRDTYVTEERDEVRQRDEITLEVVAKRTSVREGVYDGERTCQLDAATWRDLVHFGGAS